MPGTAGAQIRYSSLSTIGVGWGALCGFLGSGTTHTPQDRQVGWGLPVLVGEYNVADQDFASFVCGVLSHCITFPRHPRHAG